MSQPLPRESQQTQKQHFSYREQLPLHPNQLWRIERGVVRTLTWSEEGEIIALGLWGPSEVVGQPLTSLKAYQVECLTAVEATLLMPPPWGTIGETIARQFQQAEILSSFSKHKQVRTRLMNRPLAKLISAMLPSFSKTLRRSQLVIIESGN